MSKLITRTEHMNTPHEERNHHEYYMQFVNQATMNFARDIVEKYDLVNCEDQEHLNTPKIKHSNGGAGSWIWDYSPISLHKAHEAGEVTIGYKPSPSTCTCVGKAAAREIIKQMKYMVS